MPETDLYDTLIVGAGPAGLSAAVNLGRFLRSVVVLDAGVGRSTGEQLNDNYLGFPEGIKAVDLRDLGTRQAERFGAKFVRGTVAHGEHRDDGAFLLSGDCGEWRGRSVILCTGVTDIWPAFPGARRLVGKSLFWCIVCDGFKTIGKRILLVGADDDAVSTALQFLTYTANVTFVYEGGQMGGGGIKAHRLDLLRDEGIEVIEGRIESVDAPDDQLRACEVGGRRLEADLMFSLLGKTPNAGLAAQLGVLLDESGYVRINANQRTNVPLVYAAGDLTGPYAHQISAAVHEGATAASSANWDLYDDRVKH
jgi:thioredoxin reductase (NADPH)